MTAEYASSNSKSRTRTRIGSSTEDEATESGTNENGTVLAAYLEPKYGGTEVDQRNMQDMGRVQELRVRHPVAALPARVMDLT